MNCTMPELVNIRVGSLPGTSGADGTTVWPRSRKNSRKRARMSAVFIDGEARSNKPPIVPQAPPDHSPRSQRADMQVGVSAAKPMPRARNSCNAKRDDRGLPASLAIRPPPVINRSHTVRTGHATGDVSEAATQEKLGALGALGIFGAAVLAVAAAAAGTRLGLPVDPLRPLQLRSIRPSSIPWLRSSARMRRGP